MCPDSNLETDFGEKRARSTLEEFQEDSRGRDSYLGSSQAQKQLGVVGKLRGDFRSRSHQTLGGAALHVQAPTQAHRGQWSHRCARLRPRRAALRCVVGTCGPSRPQDAPGCAHGSPRGNEAKSKGPWRFFVPTPCRLPVRTCKGCVQDAAPRVPPNLPRNGGCRGRN